ncbi:DUF4129 domain-containing protein [Candidatus Laterigemmans baculatus]|uniref:DUF4129 domain-containing protein n=1 Tax=Candidatus Laterigemmans baculatus TaxID=2770505 RepID=UPI0013DCE850|nr:DUF4129 domain-containing protein [Candidatus Laterigemmans baculatus]
MSRPKQTAADYAVIAICPSLIIVMLTALVHFLVLCLYRGDFPGRLMYILFLFIFATTLIARIAIEEGRGYASGYAAALGLATFLVISQFVTLSGPMAELSWLFNLLLLGLIWWLADRVTFDCTVIDDAERASGEGLVSASGLFGGTGSLGAQRSRTAAADLRLDGTTSSEEREREDSRALPRKKRGHQPGRWVLYLALAALPMFGLGQLLLPDSEEIRRSALWSLGLYLFATLTLLVTTSFLGLRRYLRQRGTEMPTDVSVAWLGGGAVLVAVMLLVCFALPLPGRLVAALEVPNWVVSPEWLEPSRYGWGDEGTGSADDAPPTATQGDDSEAEQPGDGQRPTGEPSGGEQSGGEQSGGEQSGGEQSGGEQSGGEQSGGEQSGERSSEGAQRAEASSSAAESSGSGPASSPPPPSPAPSLPQLGSWLTTLVKLVIVGVLLAVIVIFAYQHRDQLREWWESVLRFFRGEVAAEGAPESEPAGISARPLRSFASFRNPLADGSDPAAAIVVSFQALEAWGREQGAPRGEEETPSEYMRRARRLLGDSAAAGECLVEAYNRVVYGQGKPTRRDLAAAEEAWRVMLRPRQANLAE